MTKKTDAKVDETFEIVVGGGDELPLAAMQDEADNGDLDAPETPEDIGPPRWMFNMSKNPVTEEEMPKTVFVNSATGETHEQLEGVFLIVQDQYLFTVFGDDGTRRMCGSKDRKIGFPTENAVENGAFPDTSPKDCENCPFLRWTPEEAEASMKQVKFWGSRGKGAPCSKMKQSLFLAFLPDGEGGEYMSPGLMRFTRTGLPAMNTFFKSTLMNRGPSVKGRRSNVPWHAVRVRISLDRVEKNEAVFAVPKIEKVGFLSNEQYLELSGQRKHALSNSRDFEGG